MLTGGPGAAHEAEQFAWNDHVVIPIRTTGGAAGGKFKVPHKIFEVCMVLIASVFILLSLMYILLLLLSVVVVVLVTTGSNSSHGSVLVRAVLFQNLCS